MFYSTFGSVNPRSFVVANLVGGGNDGNVAPRNLGAAGTLQLAFRSRSSTASGCLAITARSTREGASGRERPCSQLRNVASGKPNLAANCAWLKPDVAHIDVGHVDPRDANVVVL